MSNPMRWLINLCEAQETRASRFIREVERWVQKTSLHGVEPPSMSELGTRRVTMEPLSLGHPKVVNIILTVMGRLVDILAITLDVENVQDSKVYEHNGFVSVGTSMVRRPTQPNIAPTDQ